MSAIYLILLFVVTDAALYMRYWRPFAKRYYFLDYGIAVGWMMAIKLGSKG